MVIHSESTGGGARRQKEEGNGEGETYLIGAKRDFVSPSVLCAPWFWKALLED